MRLIDADAIVIPCDFRIEHFHDRIDEHVAYDLGRAVKKLIDAQPTVEPYKHGHWITDMSGCWCSVCNEYSDYSTDYCPNCGAKMDEVKDGLHK